MQNCNAVLQKRPVLSTSALIQGYITVFYHVFTPKFQKKQTSINIKVGCKVYKAPLEEQTQFLQDLSILNNC